MQNKRNQKGIKNINETHSKITRTSQGIRGNSAEKHGTSQENQKKQRSRLREAQQEEKKKKIRIRVIKVNKKCYKDQK